MNLLFPEILAKVAKAKTKEKMQIEKKKGRHPKFAILCQDKQVNKKV